MRDLRLKTQTFALEKSICCATSFNDANYVPVQSTDRFKTITKCEFDYIRYIIIALEQQIILCGFLMNLSLNPIP